MCLVYIAQVEQKVAHQVHALKTWFESNVRNQGAVSSVNNTAVVLYTDFLFQLPPTLTISTQYAVQYWI